VAPKVSCQIAEVRVLVYDIAAVHTKEIRQPSLKLLHSRTSARIMTHYGLPLIAADNRYQGATRTPNSSWQALQESAACTNHQVGWLAH